MHEVKAVVGVRKLEEQLEYLVTFHTLQKMRTYFKPEWNYSDTLDRVSVKQCDGGH